MKLDNFQAYVQTWCIACFGETATYDKVERYQRFFEEAVELVQACGAPARECHQLVDYVFGRPVGDTYQEIGGVMVTLAALCNAEDISLKMAASSEHDRCKANIEKIRLKQANKPKGSPLPENMADVPKATGQPIPEVGSRWVHRNGSIYTVLHIANELDEERYPLMIVYQGVNGQVWAERADNWYHSFIMCGFLSKFENSELTP